MPYIITTKRRLSCTCWGTVGEDEIGMCQACHKGGKHVSRRAVATQQGARTVADAIVTANDSVTPQDYERLLEECYVLPEVDGTIGPLPDGTAIEVERVSWADLADEAGLWGAAGTTEILDAYNAAQVARV